MGWHSSQLHSALKACWVTLSAGDGATAAHANCINSSVLLDIQHLWIQLAPSSVITVYTQSITRWQQLLPQSRRRSLAQHQESPDYDEVWQKYGS